MLKSVLTVLFCAFVCVQCIDNGIGYLPPMGWRSWNCFGGNIDQQKMMSIMDAITDRSRQVNGKFASLADIGYVHVGLDDNWQECNGGINGSFHDAQGHPVINTVRFPDMKQMNQYAHNKGVKPGWYMNNCICSESGKLQPDWPPQMHGDVDAIFALGYDGVKIDGCGPSHHLLEWSMLLNQTGRPIMIENCGNNDTFPYWNDPKKFDFLVCPMNFWRISNDIQANWNSIISNLQNTIRYQDLDHPVSQPGCYAYPDMLEVGNGNLPLEDSRSHFGAWCVVSSPLILGFDLSNDKIMTEVWPIITNTEAIAVSQTWAGHPGRLLSQAEEKITFVIPYTERDKVTMARKHQPVLDSRKISVAVWQIWAKKLNNGEQAALLLNTGDTANTITLKISDLGYDTTQKVTLRDIWQRKDIGVFSGSDSYTFAANPHASSFVRAIPM